MNISQLDHLVLTVNNIDSTIGFYRDVLGMRLETFAENRHALKFGQQKINLHQAGREFSPHAHVTVPGSADLCFITTETIEDIVTTLQSNHIAVIQGPIIRTGANGSIESVYCRDPDLNLIEISRYVE